MDDWTAKDWFDYFIDMYNSWIDEVTEDDLKEAFRHTVKLLTEARDRL